MRSISFLAVAIVVAASAIAPTSSFAAAKKQAATKSVNECIELARSRGFTSDDMATTGASRSSRAKTFVIRCMQGKQN